MYTYSLGPHQHDNASNVERTPTAHGQATTNHYVTYDLCIERTQISRLLRQRNSGRYKTNGGYASRTLHTATEDVTEGAQKRTRSSELRNAEASSHSCRPITCTPTPGSSITLQSQTKPVLGYCQRP